MSGGVGKALAYLSRYGVGKIFPPTLLAAANKTAAAAAAAAAPASGFQEVGPNRSVQLLIDPVDTHHSISLTEERVPSGASTPLHYHLTEDEVFYFVEGQYKVVVGGDVLDVGPGDSAFVPRGLVHGWVNVSDGPGRLLVGFTPSKKGHLFMPNIGIAKDLSPERLRDEYDIVLMSPPLNGESPELVSGYGGEPYQT